MSDPSQPPPLPVQPIVLGYGSPALIPQQPLIPVPEKLFHFCSTILLPLACFGITAADKYPLGPKWQRNEWQDYLGLIPNLTVGWAFYPLLVISMYAAGWMIFGTRKAIDSTVCRVGIFAGVVLAWQYALIQVCCMEITDDPHLGPALGVVIPPAFVGMLLFGRWAANALIWSRRWYREGRGKLWFWIAVTVMAMVAGVFFARHVLAILFLGSLMLAPGLTMFSFAAMAIVILKNGESPESPGTLYAGLTAWFVAWAGAWAHSYSSAVDAYAALPTSSPGCYIATAAMHGHRRFVGRREINGRSLSPQLAMLKAGELAIRLRWPGGHRVMRAVYDVIGPKLAGKIRNPVIADLVYVSLKPIEWMVVLCSAKGRMRGNANCRMQNAE